MPGIGQLPRFLPSADIDASLLLGSDGRCKTVVKMFTDVLRTSAHCVTCWRVDQQSGQYDHAKQHLALRYRHFCLSQSFSASHLTAGASYDVSEVRGLGFAGA
jgi:hypothetical protein